MKNPHIARLAPETKYRIARLGRDVYRTCMQIYAFAACIVGIYIRKKAARSAAQFSYNVFFSIFPFLICINWLMGILHINYDDLISLLQRFLPYDTISILTDYLDYLAQYQSSVTLFVGLFALITPSAAAMRALRGILNDIHCCGRNVRLSTFLLSFVSAIVLLVVVYAGIIFLFTGNWLLRLLVGYLGLSDAILRWTWMRFILFFVLISLSLYLLYRFVPFSFSKRHSLFDNAVFPGVIFSSVTLVGVSILFSFFISLTSRYSLVYGSLASIAILMLWLYTCSNVIIIGGIANRICGNHGRDMEVFRRKYPILRRK
ncbi:MAG: YihY/virulence factor BrkB family protein [Clostridia bacterium]|nr:YihY/virulence factor BrkB family protein [Clostridia bacterium]